MLDAQQILAILPHRYPMILVDTVSEVGPRRILAHKLVSQNEPFLQGHFPGRPLMPGVLIVEALAQAGALLAHQSGGFDPDRQFLLIAGIEKARFSLPVRPGQRLDLEVVTLRRGRSVWRMDGVAFVEGRVAASARFTAIIRDEDPDSRASIPWDADEATLKGLDNARDPEQPDSGQDE